MSLAVIGPLLGWMTDNVSLNTAFMFAGGIYLAAALIIVLPWVKSSHISKI